MPLRRLEWQPGFNAQETQTQNRAGWFSGNLVRWRSGLLEKLAGWLHLFSTPCEAIVRGLHGYLDLTNFTNLLIGTDLGAQLYRNNVLQDLVLSIIQAFGSDGNGGGNGPIFQPSVGSQTVTVTFANHQLTTGESIVLPMDMTCGGIKLHAQSSYVVAVVNSSTFTFQMPSNAINSNPGAFQPVFKITPNSTTQTINWPFHGLSMGNTLTFTEDTYFLSNLFIDGNVNFSMLSGSTITVTSVIDTNNFHFTGGPYGTETNIITQPEGNSDNFVTGAISYALIYTVPANATLPAVPLWSLDNLGNNGVVNYTRSPIYIYTPPQTSIFNAGPSTSPQINTGCFVAMPQAQIIAYGSETIFDSGIQDPLLLRWSDAGSYSSWTASATNQAGSYHLGGSGSKIVGGIQAPQTTLIFTDVDLWSMQYVGPPFIYSFTTIGTGCGLIAQNARAILGRTCLWVSPKGFFVFSDSGISPVICPVWDIMFTDLDTANQEKIFCGTNSSPHEIWIFYPSLSGGTGECDKYLKVNLTENLWDFGSLKRTAWLQDSVYGPPLAADNNLLIQQHEIGYDADGLPMVGVYAESGYADIDDGGQIMFIDEFMQDMKWFGSEGAASITLYGVNYPGDSPTVKGPFGLDQSNKHIRPHFRFRQIALRIDWEARLGFSARIGTPRVRAAPSGRRP